MKANPKVILWGTNAYAIRFTRSNGKSLMWIQDLTGRKAKDTNFVNRPVVQFESKETAEKEIVNIIIPYLIRDKGVGLSEIVGW